MGGVALKGNEQASSGKSIQPLLEGRDLHYAFSSKLPVLKQINFSWSMGSVVHIAGDNGAGKTTLLRILATHIRPSQGQIFWQQRDCWQRLDRYREQLSWLSSEGNGLLEQLTGLENLQLFFSLRPVRRELATAIAEWQVLTSFNKALSTPVFLSSSGMKQILGLFRCLETQGDVLLLDEPTKYLDDKAQTFLLAQLRRLQPQTLQVLVSHQQSLGDAMATLHYRIENGQLARCS